MEWPVVVLILGVIAGGLLVLETRTRGKRPSLPPSNDELSQRLRTVETSVKALGLEWDEFYDKARKALSRLGGETRATNAQARAAGEGSAEPMTHADVLRRFNAKR